MLLERRDVKLISLPPSSILGIVLSVIVWDGRSISFPFLTLIFGGECHRMKAENGTTTRHSAFELHLSQVSKVTRNPEAPKNWCHSIKGQSGFWRFYTVTEINQYAV